MKFLAAILSTFMRQTKLVGFSWDRRGSVEDKETIFFFGRMHVFLLHQQLVCDTIPDLCSIFDVSDNF